MSKKPTDVDLVIPMIPEMELTASTTAEAVGKFMRLDSLRINFEMRHSGIVGFLRGFVFESFSWSSVELSSDGVAFVLGE